MNASSSISITGVPDFWSSSSAYGITLSPGLNNFLIPREEFLNTSFGRGVLENSSELYTNTTASPPLIISGGDENLISSFGASTLLGKLSCYWQNRAVSSGSKTITGCEEAGTAAKTEGAISVLAVDSSTPPANNTGGVPGNPSLETASEAGAAVQAIVTVNVTTTNELQLLLAGLLDNVTGGVNGTFESITSEVPFMGFLGPVLGALANATLVTDGLYAAPTSTTPSPTSSSSSVLNWLWDSAAAAVLTLARGIVTLVEIAWTTEFAAWIYLAHLTREALALDGYDLARTATLLSAVGRAFLNATKSLCSTVLAGIETVLRPPVQPVRQFESSSFAQQNSAMAAYSASGGPESDPTASEVSTFASGVTPLLMLTTGLATALEIACFVLAGVAMVVGPVGPFLVIIPPSLFSETFSSGAKYSPSPNFSSVGAFVDSAGSFADTIMGSDPADAATEGDIAIWEALALSITLVVGFAAAGIAADNGAGPLSSVAIGVATALLGIAVAAVAYEQTDGITSAQYNSARAAALVCGAGSIILDIVALPKLLVSGAAFVLGAIVAFVDAYVLYIEFTNP